MTGSNANLISRSVHHVQELIKLSGLNFDFAEQLDLYVREQFLNLLRAVEQARHSSSSEEHL
jgi:hypothetical protein